jgi:hypothetical protein
MSNLKESFNFLKGFLLRGRHISLNFFLSGIIEVYGLEPKNWSQRHFLKCVPSNAGGFIEAAKPAGANCLK